MMTKNEPIWAALDLWLLRLTYSQVIEIICARPALDIALELRSTFCNLLKSLRLTLRLTCARPLRLTPILKYGPGAEAPSPFTLVLQGPLVGYETGACA